MARKYDSFATLMGLINGFGSIALGMKKMDYAEGVDALERQRQLDDEERAWNKEMEKVRIQVALDTAKMQLQEKAVLENSLVQKGIYDIFRADLGGPYEDVVDNYGTTHRTIKTPGDDMLGIVDRNDHLNLIVRKDTSTMQAVVKYNKLAKGAISNYNAGSNVAMRLDIDLNGMVTQSEINDYAETMPGVIQNHYWRTGVNNYKGDPMVGLKVKEMLRGSAQASIDMEYKHGAENITIVNRKDEITGIDYRVIIPLSFTEGYDPGKTAEGQISEYEEKRLFNRQQYANTITRIQTLASDVMTMQNEMHQEFPSLQGEFKSDYGEDINNILTTVGTYEMKDMDKLKNKVVELQGMEKKITSKLNTLSQGQFMYNEMLRAGQDHYIDDNKSVNIDKMMRDYKLLDPDSFAETGGAGFQKSFNNLTTQEARIHAANAEDAKVKKEDQTLYEQSANARYTEAKTMYAGTDENPFDIRDHLKKGLKMNDNQLAAFNTFMSLGDSRAAYYYLNENEDVMEWVESGVSSQGVGRDFRYRIKEMITNMEKADDKIAGLTEEVMSGIYENINAVIAGTDDPMHAYNSSLPEMAKGKKLADRNNARQHFFTTFEETHGYDPRQVIKDKIRTKEIDTGEIYAPFGTIPTDMTAKDVYEIMSKTQKSVAYGRSAQYPTHMAFGGSTNLLVPYGNWNSKYKGKERFGEYQHMSNNNAYTNSVWNETMAGFLWNEYDMFKTYVNAGDEGYGRGEDPSSILGGLSEWAMEASRDRKDPYAALTLLGIWKDASNETKVKDWKAATDNDLAQKLGLAQDAAREAVIQALAQAMSDPNSIEYASLMSWWDRNR